MPASRRRRFAAACLATACAVGAVAQSRPGRRARDPRRRQHDERSARRCRLLAIADRLGVRLGALWSEPLRRYEPGPGATDSEVNADLLLVHSAAARAGHTAPHATTARARAAARFLTGREIWHGGAHPGWWASPDVANQHVVFEAEVAEGLAAAYAARRAIGLDARTVRLIRRQLATVAASPDWRWPALVMNQLNWYATVFAADATVNGTGRTLAWTLSRHLARFTAEASSHGDVPGNFGPGLRFHYQPRASRTPA